MWQTDGWMNRQMGKMVNIFQISSVESGLVIEKHKTDRWMDEQTDGQNGEWSFSWISSVVSGWVIFTDNPYLSTSINNDSTSIKYWQFWHLNTTNASTILFSMDFLSYVSAAILWQHHDFYTILRPPFRMEAVFRLIFIVKFRVLIITGNLSKAFMIIWVDTAVVILSSRQSDRVDELSRKVNIFIPIL